MLLFRNLSVTNPLLLLGNIRRAELCCVLCVLSMALMFCNNTKQTERIQPTSSITLCISSPEAFYSITGIFLRCSPLLMYQLVKAGALLSSASFTGCNNAGAQCCMQILQHWQSLVCAARSWEPQALCCCTCSFTFSVIESQVSTQGEI